MKDLGNLSTFLKIQASYTPFGFLLHQQSYAASLLWQVGMEHCHDLPNPTAIKTPSMPDDQHSYTASINYCQLVSTLQYLTIMRPNLSFSVNKLCQHMHHPLNYHYHSLKWVLCYVQAKKSHNILISPTNLHLIACCDAIG